MPTSTSVVLAAASFLALLAEFSSNVAVLALTFDGIGYGDTRYAFLKRSQRNSMLYQQVQLPQPYHTSPYMDQSAILSNHFAQPVGQNDPRTENQPKSALESFPEKVPSFYMADEFGGYKRANLRRLVNQSARGFGRK